MTIAIRLFAGYFLIVGIAAWFLVSIFAREVEPGVRQATEETLIDAANLLAELAADELAAGTIGNGRFAVATERALARDPKATIWDVSKNTIDMRIVVTNDHGTVLFDSANESVGADFSQWRDVARILRGEYGARHTRDDPNDSRSASMYVAAPVRQHGKLIGVISVSKPIASLMPYADRASDRVKRAGIVLLAISALIGVGFTIWLTWSLNRLRDYALAVAQGQRATPPISGGRQLSVLAKSLALMREKLDGKQYVEQYVQNLTHELKSPLTAVRGAAELLQESPSTEDGRRFAGNITEQAERMQRIIERLLDLARVEQLQNPEERQFVKLAELVDAVVRGRTEQLALRRLSIRAECDRSIAVVGDPFLLQQALGNVVDNAIEFSPEGGMIVISVGVDPGHIIIAVSDQGQGAPDYALAHMFERFYSLPRPATGRKSTGLGLAFVREVARLHGGTADFANRPEGGATASIRLPR